MFDGKYSYPTWDKIHVDEKRFPLAKYEFSKNQCPGNCSLCYFLQRECPKEKDKR